MPRSEPLLRVFIGYDRKESVAFSVLAASILKRATIPVAIVPLTRQSLDRIYTRPRGPTEATEFSMTRFLVPYLSNYEGLSVFMDCDMLCQVDLLELWLELSAQPGKAVWCCQHDYVPKDLVKFDGHEQTRYPRKNWSSFMVFDNAQCQSLTPAYVNTATGLELHRFHWVTPSVERQEVFRLGQTQPEVITRTLTADERIGALPLTWNWLVGEYDPNPDAKVLHYTLGTPCFDAYQDCDHADRWWAEYEAMLSPVKALQLAR